MGGVVKSVKKAVSSVGKTARKIIPNEVADIAVKAAPFVAPFNPLLAGGMAAIGSYDQTGSFGRALKSGLFTYGGGQLARGIGGAGFQQGINPFAGADFSQGIMSGIRSLGSSPIGTQTGLKLGQYEIFGGTPPTQGVGEQIADQGIINRSNALVGQPVPGADPGVFVEQTTLPLEQATKQLTQTNINQAAKKTTGDLLKTIVSPQSTLGERGTALKDLGGKALKTVFLNKDGSIDKLAVGATIAGATSYMEAKKLAEEAELVENADDYTEEMYEADKARYDDYYEQILPEEAFGLKDGGRIGYAFGSPENTGRKEGITSITLSETTDDLDSSTEKPEGIETILDDKLSYYIPGFSSKDLSKLYKVLGKEGGKNVDFKNLHKVLSNPNDYPEAIIEIREMLGIPGKKDGGRMQYAMGTEVPIRENQAGVNEMDFRQTGGFVPPIGVKERADDIPAMLSNNEFVFTADAVRAAGGGSVNKGAKRMYDLMKSLEGKVV